MAAKAGGGSMSGDEIASIVATLGQHDVHIQGLNRRMGQIEESVEATRSDLNRGFTDLGSKLTALEQTKPPPFGQIVKVTTGVATIVSLVCAGVIWLVISLVTPEQVRLASDIKNQGAQVSKFEQERDAELAALRDAEKKRLEQRLISIESQLGWKQVEVEVRRAPK